jgi:branched-subunit amino acid aminotransferase/4-amino-4-deoxychorismate lyase
MPKVIPPERELERIERFRRIARARANHALEHIERLMRTADRTRYSYTDEQVAEVIGKLRQAVDQLEVAYAQERRGGLRVEL